MSWRGGGEGDGEGMGDGREGRGGGGGGGGEREDMGNSGEEGDKELSVHSHIGYMYCILPWSHPYWYTAILH